MIKRKVLKRRKKKLAFCKNICCQAKNKRKIKNNIYPYWASLSIFVFGVGKKSSLSKDRQNGRKAEPGLPLHYPRADGRGWS